MARLNPFSVVYDSMRRVDTKRCFELAYGHIPKGGEEPLEFPKELHIELTNRCNLRCPFCPVGNGSMKRISGFMREDLFWAICTEAKEYSASLRLIRFGEPTLHVKCFDYIKMAKSIGLLVHLNTNGVKLDVKEVLDSGLDSIKVSIHNAKALKPLRKLVQARGDKEKPYIIAGYLKGIESPTGVEADNFDVGECEDLTKGGRAPKSCWELYNRLSINWDGIVVACCGSYDNQMRIGHIYGKNTLKEIWGGENLKRYREMEQKNQLQNVPLCDKCCR